MPERPSPGQTVPDRQRTLQVAGLGPQTRRLEAGQKAIGLAGTARHLLQRREGSDAVAGGCLAEGGFVARRQSQALILLPLLPELPAAEGRQAAQDEPQDPGSVFLGKAFEAFLPDLFVDLAENVAHLGLPYGKPRRPRDGAGTRGTFGPG